MGSYVSFVNTARDWDCLAKFHTATTIIRVTPSSLARRPQGAVPGVQLWVDPCFDAFAVPKRDHRPPEWQEHVDRINGHDALVETLYVKQSEREHRYARKPDEDAVSEFVAALLDSCAGSTPDWISIPQVPTKTLAGQTTLNTLLARSSGEWSKSTPYKGRLILPVILCSSSLYANASTRRKVLDAICGRFDSAGAHGLWLVDATLDDQSGSRNHRRRFQNLIALHSELKMRKAVTDSTTIVAGPYWAMNLVMWARGLATHAATCLGTSYQYRIPRNPKAFPEPMRRVALPPLRRWVVAEPTLRKWLEQAITVVQQPSSAHVELSQVLSQWSSLMGASRAARAQVAEFYAAWIDGLEATPPEGRAIRLYQEFSAAFVLGKSLARDVGNLPDGRAPWKVAEQFMLNCL